MIKRNEKLAEDFRRNAVVASATAPLYAQLFSYVATQPGLLGLFDELPPEKHQPMLLMAVVRYLTISNPDEQLSHLYENPDGRDVPEKIESAFFEFCDDYEYEIRRITRHRVVQTNETNRCCALLPALMKIQRDVRRTLALVDVGASAGFNLLFDRFRYDYAGGGALGPPGAHVRLSCELRNTVPKLEPNAPLVDFRVGVDLDPIKLGKEADEAWLRACIWVGDVGAEQRLSAALELARREWADVRSGDAIEELQRLVTNAPDSDELVIFNSFTMSWMNAEERQQFCEVVRYIGHYRPVWWITYEGQGIVPGVRDVDTSAPALLALRYIQPMGEELNLLARAGINGEWMEWLDPDTTVG